MSKEDDINIIMESDSKEIIRAMLDGLYTVNNGTFVGALRRKLTPKWYDGIWKPSGHMYSTIDIIFTYRRDETRHFNGGSWSPECDFTVKLYTCDLCGDIIDEDDREKHIRNGCAVAKTIFDISENLSEFKSLLIERSNL